MEGDKPLLSRIGGGDSKYRIFWLLNCIVTCNLAQLTHTQQQCFCSNEMKINQMPYNVPCFYSLCS